MAKEIVDIEQPPSKEAFVSACEHGYDQYNHAPRRSICQVDKTEVFHEPILVPTEVEVFIPPAEKTAAQVIAEEQGRIANWQERIVTSEALIAELQKQPDDKPIGEIEIGRV